MAKVRAYKIAEELGIERNEFVAKAKELGVELRSAMASVEDEDAEILRRKLGAHKTVERETRRVETKGGSAVLRRRKKVVAPEPEPTPVVEEPEASVPEEGELATPGSVEEGTETVVPESIAEEAAAAGLAPAPVAEEAQKPIGKRSVVTDTPEIAPEREKKRVRKRVVVEGNLQEQEKLARQVTGRKFGAKPLVVETRQGVSPRKKRRDALARPAVKSISQAKKIVRVDGTISVQELAAQLGEKAPIVQGKLMGIGVMASINQMLDFATAAQLAKEYGYEARHVGFQEEVVLASSAAAVEDELLETRPPVITVMGHVDHGKTSLLDAIRKAKVTEGEAGGITQHIGAYQVTIKGKMLTFIDTPGHEAFTTMRARGANATDLVVLVVAASEGPMPQTVESINHARTAGVPIIVAVNKCDLPDANPSLTRQRLLEHELVPEEFGGDVLCVEVSAKTGDGIDILLESIALQSEMLELRADANRPGAGVVLEGELDKSRGPVASILVQSGTVKRGDFLVAGTACGRIRDVRDENGKRVTEAGPSRPVEVLGLSSVPEAGQAFNIVENERAAKELVSYREAEIKKKRELSTRPVVSLEAFFAQAEGSGPKELNIVLKADVQGSVEALRDSLEKLSTEKVGVNVLHSGVGGITESDVMLAAASEAIIIGFAVRPDVPARRAADSNSVDVRTYKVIYEALDEVRTAMAGLLAPTRHEVSQGRAEIREVFVIPKVGAIAGCQLSDGFVKRNSLCRVVRDGVVVYESKVSSLRRFKDDVSEVKQGMECGIGVENFNDLKAGDVIEAFEMEERVATLE